MNGDVRVALPAPPVAIIKLLLKSKPVSGPIVT